MPTNLIMARTGEDNAAKVAPIPMDLRIAVNEQEQLESIVAFDREGNEYVVSIKLQRAQNVLCCCTSPTGRVYCYYTDHCDCGNP